MTVAQHDLPTNKLPRGEFDVADLPDELPQYSGDLDSLDVGEVPRAVHMAFAIALTEIDNSMAFHDAQEDALDAVAQAWRAVMPDGQTVTVDYGRAYTSVDVRDEVGE